MLDVKTCPFCDSNKQTWITEVGNHYYSVAIECTSCGARGKNFFYNTLEKEFTREKAHDECLEHWNIRKGEK